MIWPSFTDFTTSVPLNTSLLHLRTPCYAKRFSNTELKLSQAGKNCILAVKQWAKFCSNTTFLFFCPQCFPLAMSVNWTWHNFFLKNQGARSMEISAHWKTEPATQCFITQIQPTLAPSYIGQVLSSRAVAGLSSTCNLGSVCCLEVHPRTLCYSVFSLSSLLLSSHFVAQNRCLQLLMRTQDPQKIPLLYLWFYLVFLISAQFQGTNN